jgi:hypothetical protein
MKKHLVAIAAAALIAGVVASQAQAADAIPYAPIGTYNDASYSFTAAGGAITAYFYGADAGYDNTIGLSINGGAPGVFGLDDHTSLIGDSLVLGTPGAGDNLVFVLRTNGGADVFSDPLQNGGYDGSTATGYDPSSIFSNGHNHIYATPFSGNDTIPAGEFIAFEDLSFPGSDYDYNDETFVVTGLSQVTTQGFPPVLIGTPEPCTWAMMLFGVAAVGAGLRGARSRRAVLAGA